MSFKLFNISYNKTNDFIINFDDVWNWIGFGRKDHAKRLLKIKFKENIHYKIFLPRMGEQDLIENSHEGNNKEEILLTANTFKKFCLMAATDKSTEIYDYYIKMEEIIFKYIQEQNKYHQNMLLEKDKQILEMKNNNMLLDDKNNLLNQKYVEIEKNKYIYLFSTDK
jgi:phage anti-repressor protein